MKKICLFLLLLHSTNFFAQVWRSPVLVEIPTGKGGDCGEYNSMLNVNGKPAIAFGDNVHGNLMFVRAQDKYGSAWETSIIVDFLGYVGEYCSLEIVNGNPAISYYDYDKQDLKYVRALDPDGLYWNTPVVIDTKGNVGEYNSLKCINGMPAIAYFDNTNADLKYAIAIDSLGLDWNLPISIDVTGYVGRCISLQLVDGYPAISYLDGSNLKYIRSLDPFGKVWGAAQIIDPVGNMPQSVNTTSLRIVNGKPAICYRDNLDNLKYIRAQDSTGKIWNTPVSLGLLGKVGRNSSLNIVNGKPAISCGSSTGIRYMQALDADGTTWSTPILLEKYAVNVSLQEINGRPAISYSYKYLTVGYQLKYVIATDSAGTNWTKPFLIGTPGNMGLYLSAQMVNGNPALAYYDAYNHDLRFARAKNSSGSEWNTSLLLDNPDDTLNVEDSGLYTSQTIVNGNPAIAYFGKGGLKYLRSLDASGTSWPKPTVIKDAIGYFYSSVQTANGNPVIVYNDLEASKYFIHYVRALDVNGTTWGKPILVDTSESNSGGSFQIVNGIPALAYFDLKNKDLKYTRAIDANGSSWALPKALDTQGDVGHGASLKLVNGNPAIAYYSETDKTLKYIRAMDSDGISWYPPVTIDTAITLNFFALNVINGKPVISFSTDTLKYIISNDTNGDTWGTKINLGVFGNGCIMMQTSNSTSIGIAYYHRNEQYPYYLFGNFCNVSADAPTLVPSTNTICNGESVKLNVSGGSLNDAISWQWYQSSCNTNMLTAANSITVAPHTTTTYFVRGEGPCVAPGACTDITISVNSFPDVTINLKGNAITASQGGASYQWLNCNNNQPILNETNQRFIPTENGRYSVIVNLNGCSDTSTCITILTTGIEQNISTDDLQILPNPNNGSFSVQSAASGTYSIINELGQTLQLVELNSENNHTVQIEHLKSGVYFIVGYEHYLLIRKKIVVTR